MHEASRHREMWVPSHRSRTGESVSVVVAVDQVGHPRGTAGRRHQRVELMFGKHGVDALVARVPTAPGQSVEVLLAGELTSALGLLEEFLFEPGHFVRAVKFVRS